VPLKVTVLAIARRRTVHRQDPIEHGVIVEIVTGEAGDRVGRLEVDVARKAARDPPPTSR
jgi:hypothetical protein